MTRKITIMALIGGVVLGAAATEGYNVYRQSQDSYRQLQASQSFQQRVHCKAVADAYVKENTDLNDNSVMGKSVTLDKVDYSPARNSCVAEVDTNRFFSGGGTENESVQDLLSGETLFSVETQNSVKGTDDYGSFRVMFLPRVWDYVMNNASEPVELEKEWTLVESTHPPKATAPASSPITLDFSTAQPIASPQQKKYLDPNTGEPIQIDPITGERIQAPAPQHKSAAPSKR